jgi:hypothetical protein
MRRAAHFARRFILALVLAVFASTALDFLVLDGPRITDRVFSPSLVARCSALRQGMSQGDLLQRIDGWHPATFQMLRGNSIEFSQDGEGSCKIEMDPITKTVVKAQWQSNERGKYDLSGADAYPEQ